MLAKTTSSLAIVATAAFSLSGSGVFAAPAAIPTQNTPAPIQKPAPRILAQDAPSNPIGLSHTFPPSSYFAKSEEGSIRDVSAPTLTFVDRATLSSFSSSRASTQSQDVESLNQNSTTTKTPIPFLSTDPWRPNRQIRAQIPLSPEADVDALRIQIGSEMSNLTTAVTSKHDTRERWTDMSYPYSAMGRLTWDDGTWCSATLVGPRHVAAAGHCAPPAAPGNPADAESGAAATVATARVRFEPQAGVSRNVEGGWVREIITLGEKDKECKGNGDDNGGVSSSDWAIFVLDNPLGQKYGWLGTKTLEELSSEKEKEDQFETTAIIPDTTFYQYGYAGDKKVKGQQEEDGRGAFPYRQEGISVFDAPTIEEQEETEEGEGDRYWNPSNGACFNSSPLIHTDATVGPGESGGALFRGPDRRGRFYAYGVLTGSSRGSNSFSAGGDEWVAAVNWAREEFA